MQTQLTGIEANPVFAAALFAFENAVGKFQEAPGEDANPETIAALHSCSATRAMLISVINAHVTTAALLVSTPASAGAAASVSNPAAKSADPGYLDTWLKSRLGETVFDELLSAFGSASAALYQDPDEPVDAPTPERPALAANGRFLSEAVTLLALSFGATCYTEGQRQGAG